MKKLSKLIVVLLLFLSNLTGFATTASAASNNFTVQAKAAIAVDADSGKILYNQKGNSAGQGIASITKLLTVYMVYDAVKSGKLKWTDKVDISDYAYQLTQSTVASNIPFTKGESFTVKDLVNAALVPSANSAAIALAEKIGGSEPKFVDLMIAKLKSWGINDAKLVNSSGLSNADLPQANWYPNTTANDENTMSAKDVAIIATHLLTDFPEVLNITKQTSMVFDQGGASQTTMNTTDFMLPGTAYARDGVDGLKTGTTQLAGNCFVGTTDQNGFRVITVVLNADDGSGSENSRFTETNNLMTYVYGTWTVNTLTTSNAPLEGYTEAPVLDGKQATVPLITKSAFALTTLMDSPQYTQIKINKVRVGVQAPFGKGKVVASAKASVSDKLGYLPGYSGSTVELITKDAVAKANPFVVAWNHFVRFVNEQL